MPISAAERDVVKWFTDPARFPVPAMFPVMNTIWTRMGTEEKKTFMEAILPRFSSISWYQTSKLFFRADPKDTKPTLHRYAPYDPIYPRPVYVLLEDRLDMRPAKFRARAGPPNNGDWSRMWTERMQQRQEGKPADFTQPDRVSDQLGMIRNLLLVDNGEIFENTMTWFRAIYADRGNTDVPAKRIIHDLVALRATHRPHVVIRSDPDGHVIEGSLEAVSLPGLWVTIRPLTGPVQKIRLHPEDPRCDEDLDNILHGAIRSLFTFLRSSRTRGPMVDEHVNQMIVEFAGMRAPRQRFVQRRMVSNFNQRNPRYAMPLLDPPAAQ
jgi:hypothetical protein